MLNVTVFYIEDETHAEIKGTKRQPFVHLKGTILSVSSDTNPEVDITFHCNLFTSSQVVSFINSASGVSGFYAKEKDGFVVLESKTLGQLSSLTVTNGNSILGITPETVYGSDQKQVIVPVEPHISEISPGMFAVSFPIKCCHQFSVYKSYFVEMSDGITTTVKRFKVLNNENSATVNFVS
jgi:hypothetical protein